MMYRGRAYVEFDETGKPIRVFRNEFTASTSEAWKAGRVKEYPRKDAVAGIRIQIFERAKNSCENCGKLLTFGTMQMDEKIPRSKGGEISVFNSWALCHNCHTKKHNRIPKWTAIKSI